MQAFKALYVNALRDSVKDAFGAIVKDTYQDSGNAAVHWMVGAKGKGDPARRKLGTYKDLRATPKHGAKDQWVGFRGDMNSITGHAAEVANNVLGREIHHIINKQFVGNNPPNGVTFYNAILGMSTSYTARANLQGALARGVRVLHDSFERKMKDPRYTKMRFR